MHREKNPHSCQCSNSYGAEWDFNETRRGALGWAPPVEGADSGLQSAYDLRAPGSAGSLLKSLSLLLPLLPPLPFPLLTHLSPSPSQINK